LSLLHPILRGVRQLALVVLDPNEIPPVDPAVARLASKIMFGLTDAPLIGALAKHVPRGLGSSSDMIAGIGSPPLALLPLYTSRGAVGSVTQSLPVEPTGQKIKPGLLRARSLHDARGTSARAAIHSFHFLEGWARHARSRRGGLASPDLRRTKLRFAERIMRLRLALVPRNASLMRCPSLRV
jgi:hypothetical protein